MLTFEEFYGKKLDLKGCQRWLYEHEIEVQRFLDNNYFDEDDKVLMWQRFINSPLLAKEIIKNYDTPLQFRNKKFFDAFLSKPNVLTIIGKRGTGKTVLSFDIAEKAKKQKPELNLFVWGMSYEEVEGLPEYYTPTMDAHSMPQNSLLIFDEAAVHVNARRAMSKENVSAAQLLAIARHKNFWFIYSSQLSTAIDKQIWEHSDFLVFKPLMFGEISGSDNSRTQKGFMQYITALYPNEKNKRECLVFTGEEWIKFENDKPKWWNENLSKTYQQISQDKAILLVKEWSKKNLTPKDISKELKLRGIQMIPEEVAWILKHK